MKLKLAIKKAKPPVQIQKTINFVIKQEKESKEALLDHIENTLKPAIQEAKLKEKLAEEQTKKSEIQLPKFVMDFTKLKMRSSNTSVNTSDKVNSFNDSITNSSEPTLNTKKDEESTISDNISISDSDTSPSNTLTLKTVSPETKEKSSINLEDLNKEQFKAISYASYGIDFCLIGAAGSGKTTTQRILTQSLVDSGRISTILDSRGSKMFHTGMHSILICSFTNKAVENIRNTVPDEFKDNCMTIHKAIEFAPYSYEEEDADGVPRKRFVFKPRRNAENKLPPIDLCIIEEASTVGLGLMAQLLEALPTGTKFIFIGDLNQLPPITDDAILGFALNNLPIIELTQIYRQALQSPIIDFAHKILSGKGLKQTQIETLQDSYDRNQLTFSAMKKWEPPRIAMKKIGHHFQTLAELEKLDVFSSVVLLPFNTGGYVNASSINKYIAQGISNRTKYPIYEIIAGWNKYYYSEGDLLFVNKNLYVISKIELNYNYSGLPPMPASTSIDRWGHASANEQSEHSDTLLNSTVDMDDILEEVHKSMESQTDDEEDSRKQQASHILTLVPIEHYLNTSVDDEATRESTISTAAEFNEATFGYALTIHKSQGSEWQKVYLILLDEHSRMLNRELIYTGVTRARKKLTILYAPEGTKKNKSNKTVPFDCVLNKGITTQAIVGKDLKAKLNYYTNAVEFAKKKLMLKAKAEARADMNGEKPTPEYIEAVYNKIWSEHPMSKITTFFEDIKKESKLAQSQVEE